MHKAAMAAFLGGALVITVGAAAAQPGSPSPVESKAAVIDAMLPAPSAEPRLCAQGTVPALTVVKLRLREALGTRTSKIGQIFTFELAAPVMLGNCIAVPAGIQGQGEVIHVKKSSLTGAGGEFVGAARFLDFDGRRIALRSLQLRIDGGVERGYNYVRVYDVEFPAGMVVEAKLAGSFELAPAG